MGPIKSRQDSPTWATFQSESCSLLLPPATTHMFQTRVAAFLLLITFALALPFLLDASDDPSIVMETPPFTTNTPLVAAAAAAAAAASSNKTVIKLELDVRIQIASDLHRKYLEIRYHLMMLSNLFHNFVSISYLAQHNTQQSNSMSDPTTYPTALLNVVPPFSPSWVTSVWPLPKHYVSFYINKRIALNKSSSWREITSFITTRAVAKSKRSRNN